MIWNGQFWKRFLGMEEGDLVSQAKRISVNWSAADAEREPKLDQFSVNSCNWCLNDLKIDFRGALRETWLR
jgi:hypothetical protein